MSNDLVNQPSNELEIENDFLRRFAQTEVSQEQANQFSSMTDNAPAESGDTYGNATDLDQPGGEVLPNLDTDAEEMQAIQNLIQWDSFVIIFDPHHAKLLEDTLTLPPAKARAKSYYIYYSPENKRLEGVVNKRYIGGYGTKEDLGEDFSFIKTLSPEGFSPEWKEKLLIDIDSLPAGEDSLIREKLKEKQKTEDEGQSDVNVQQPEQKSSAPAKSNTVDFPKPQPVGKADPDEMPLAASMRAIQMRRLSRMNALMGI